MADEEVETKVLSRVPEFNQALASFSLGFDSIGIRKMSPGHEAVQFSEGVLNTLC